MSNRITPIFFGIIFISAVAIASVFGGVGLLLFLLTLGALIIGERAFVLRRR